MRSGRIHRWEERVQGSMRPIVRFRSGLRPSLHRTMEVKTQNQISHDMWFKEWGHSNGRGNRYEFMQDELSVDEVEWQEGHGWLVFFLSNLN